ncbi:uncharacterized protein LOC128594926 isoform X2 [Nycticebus coucang]|uniref:uncharacterized protein LOC128594926 isoform X2 n=1 Tax=Nycticebus coucang TaxID=9470 RepID=UPI00234C6169|nr:uncharacterized protein LOC128594926 isoform X2 [Nycticebus coucang]
MLNGYRNQQKHLWDSCITYVIVMRNLHKIMAFACLIMVPALFYQVATKETIGKVISTDIEDKTEENYSKYEIIIMVLGIIIAVTVIIILILLFYICCKKNGRKNGHHLPVPDIIITENEELRKQKDKVSLTKLMVLSPLYISCLFIDFSVQEIHCFSPFHFVQTVF